LVNTIQSTFHNNNNKTPILSHLHLSCHPYSHCQFSLKTVARLILCYTADALQLILKHFKYELSTTFLLQTKNILLVANLQNNRFIVL